MSEADVRDLAESWFRALEALVYHASAPGAGGRTPSDLPLVALTQAEIERLESDYPQIEDVLPLSPLQEGLLFHALYDAQVPTSIRCSWSWASRVSSTARRCTLRRARSSNAIPVCARASGRRA
jgi:hypothetical protein